MHPRTIVLALAVGLIALGLVPQAGAADGPQRSPVRIAIQHVTQNADDYGVSRADVADLAVTDAYRSDHNGVTHVYLQQQRNGLDVEGSSATVNVMPDGSILYVGPRLVPDLDRASGRVVLGAAQAAARAAGQLGLQPSEGFRVLSSSAEASRATVLSDGGISLSPIPAHLVYQALENGSIRLAWQLQIEERSQEHWWHASVDAQTGELLVAYDWVDHEAEPDGSSYRVYALPLESPNDGERSLVENPADAAASPLGWHDTNGQAGPEFTTTQGNNVHAYIDTHNAGMGLPLMDANGGAGLDFDFPFDPASPPTLNKDSATTNLFYWSNIVHDVFYGYGFDEASGNFQVNNYERGGAGNDSVQAEAQDGSGVNNANFGTPPDGQRPRMQMYVWSSTFTQNHQLIDGDFDSGVIVHESGHGISNRLTGGPANSDCLRNEERPSEGWSDWLAIALLARPGDTGEQKRGMGTYVLGQPNREAKGIRPTPYTTNMTVNRSTYNTIKTAAVPHGVGYVWATMTWEVFWNLVEKHGFNPNPFGDWTTGGNNLAIQLIMDGMKMQPCSPGFVDARDAILAADVALTGGLNQCEVWRGFAKRGLGLSAKQGSSTSRSDGTQAFDLPPECVTTT